jgi:hypothetical protein
VRLEPLTVDTGEVMSVRLRAPSALDRGLRTLHTSTVNRVCCKVMTCTTSMERFTLRVESGIHISISVRLQYNESMQRLRIYVQLMRFHATTWNDESMQTIQIDGSRWRAPRGY